MIIETLVHGEGHMTAEEIFTQLQGRTHAINLATVYRTLDLLVACGLATRTNAWDGKMVYATMLHGPHIHLVCRRCGKVIDAEHQYITSLGKQLQTTYNFTAELQHITIFGLCGDCQLNHLDSQEV
jgi:Fur family ferric uptake transcriptional regulator